MFLKNLTVQGTVNDCTVIASMFFICFQCFKDVLNEVRAAGFVILRKIMTLFERC